MVTVAGGARSAESSLASDVATLQAGSGSAYRPRQTAACEPWAAVRGRHKSLGYPLGITAVSDPAYAPFS